MTEDGRANAQRLRELRGRYEGRRCFVMGNGPSLLQCDLNRLANEVTIVSNAHYLIWDQLTYIPTFLAVEDRLVAEDRAHELRALTEVTKIFPFDLRPLLGAADATTLYIDFPRDYRGLAPDGSEWPALDIWVRDGAAVRHFWAGESAGTQDPGQDPHGAPDPTPLWTMLDLTPGGRGTDWYPKLDYGP